MTTLSPLRQLVNSALEQLAERRDDTGVELGARALLQLVQRGSDRRSDAL